jgi:hypothetical protein
MKSKFSVGAKIWDLYNVKYILQPSIHLTHITIIEGTSEKPLGMIVCMLSSSQVLRISRCHSLHGFIEFIFHHFTSMNMLKNLHPLECIYLGITFYISI